MWRASAQLSEAAARDADARALFAELDRREAKVMADFDALLGDHEPGTLAYAGVIGARAERHGCHRA